MNKDKRRDISTITEEDIIYFRHIVNPFPVKHITLSEANRIVSTLSAVVFEKFKNCSVGGKNGGFVVVPSNTDTIQLVHDMMFSITDVKNWKTYVTFRFYKNDKYMDFEMMRRFDV